MDGSQKEDGKLPEIDAYSEDMGSRELVKQYRDLKWVRRGRCLRHDRLVLSR